MTKNLPQPERWTLREQLRIENERKYVTDYFLDYQRSGFGAIPDGELEDPMRYTHDRVCAIVEALPELSDSDVEAVFEFITIKQQWGEYSYRSQVRDDTVRYETEAALREEGYDFDSSWQDAPAVPRRPGKLYLMGLSILDAIAFAPTDSAPETGGVAG